ncbi:MAG: Yip1 family protein [Hyphomonadaceae bacterium]
MAAENPDEAQEAQEAAHDGAQASARTRAAQAGQQARAKAEFILSRAYGLFRDPTAEWEQIRKEETNAASLMLGYVAPLAAIPPLAGAFGQFAFARGITGGPSDIIVGAATSFLVFLAIVYFLGFLTNAIAENFEGDKDELAALKAIAYSSTPAFLSGAFALWPSIWWVGLIGTAYSAFLLYRGLPPLMKTPADRTVAYAATIIAAGLVAAVVLGALTSALTGSGGL